MSLKDKIKDHPLSKDCLDMKQAFENALHHAQDQMSESFGGLSTKILNAIKGKKDVSTDEATHKSDFTSEGM